MAGNSNKNNANNANKKNKNGKAAAAMVTFLFQLQIATKMFHWQTRTYAHHVAAGTLYDAIVSLTDRIMEQFIGTHVRPRMPPRATVGVPNVSAADMKDMLRHGISFLSGPNMPADANIRPLCDELAGVMAQTLYLLEMS